MWDGSGFHINISIFCKIHVISTTLKACLKVLSVLLILGLWEYYRKCCSASGSTPVLKKQSVGPLLREYSHKSGIVLPGVLPKKLILYTGSDLDMIYNLDILLPLDTLGALPVLLFLVSGSTPRRLFFVSGSAFYICYNTPREQI